MERVNEVYNERMRFVKYIQVKAEGYSLEKRYSELEKLLEYMEKHLEEDVPYNKMIKQFWKPVDSFLMYPE